jgi:hypothetical protein
MDALAPFRAAESFPAPDAHTGALRAHLRRGVSPDAQTSSRARGSLVEWSAAGWRVGQRRWLPGEIDQVCAG